jgi:hypothetical protein
LLDESHDESNCFGVGVTVSLEVFLYNWRHSALFRIDVQHFEEGVLFETGFALELDENVLHQQLDQLYSIKINSLLHLQTAFQSRRGALPLDSTFFLLNDLFDPGVTTLLFDFLAHGIYSVSYSVWKR